MVTSTIPTSSAKLMAVVALILASSSAHPQTARSGGGASAQLLQQMQQLASERTGLQAENAKLKKDLESMRKERDDLKTKQTALDKRMKTSESSLKALEQGAAERRDATDRELAQSKTRMQELVAKFRETAQSLRDVETDRTTTKQTLATRDQELGTCVDRNMALYKLNREVLTRLEAQGTWSRLGQVEPFTKIKRVQLENLVDEYKSRADDVHLKPASPPPPATTAPPIAKDAASSTAPAH